MADVDLGYIKFLKNVGPVLLKEYFEKISIDIPSDLDLEQAEATFEFIKKLPIDKYRKIEEDFLKIIEFTSSGATDDINDELQYRGYEAPEYKTGEEFAMWAFLKDEGILEAVDKWDFVETSKSWDEVVIQEGINHIDWKNGVTALKQKIILHFWEKEKRHIQCASEIFEHPDKILIVLYPEGKPRAVNKLKQDGSIDYVSERPLQEIYFIVDLKEKKVSFKTQVSYSWQRKDDLKALFFDKVLQQQYPGNRACEYQLNHFMEKAHIEGLKNVLPPDAPVEYVKIIAMEYDDLKTKDEGVILKAEAFDENLFEIYDVMERRNVNKTNAKVKKVRFQLKFNDLGQSNNCKFYVAWPNRHTLRRGEKGDRIKEYFKYWGIVKAEKDENK